MKHLLSAIVIITISLFTNETTAQEIKVMSYNIRYDTEADGENSWDNRKEDVVKIISKNNPFVFGVQEALENQVEYISKNTKYSYIGKGRDDGKTEGEYSPIFYDSSALELVNSGMFWLSETPTKPSLGWDACCKRVVTWAEFKYQNKSFFFFNTHFDHQGKVAKSKSSELLLTKVSEIAKSNPILITGDFNFSPDNCNYQYMVDPMLKVFVKDSYTNSKKVFVENPTTFRGFSIEKNNFSERIDYLFFNNNIEILSYKIDESNNGKNYYSDHVPIIILLNIYTQH